MQILKLRNIAMAFALGAAYFAQAQAPASVIPAKVKIDSFGTFHATSSGTIKKMSESANYSELNLQNFNIITKELAKSLRGGVQEFEGQPQVDRLMIPFEVDLFYKTSSIGLNGTRRSQGQLVVKVIAGVVVDVTILSSEDSQTIEAGNRVFRTVTIADLEALTKASLKEHLTLELKLQNEIYQKAVDLIKQIREEQEAAAQAAIPAAK